MSTTRKVILVTGCSIGGLGYELCQEYARRGCKVYASARSPDKLEGLSSGIEKLELDVSRDETITRSVQTILENDGRIDILVNNAGVQCVAPLMDLPSEDLRSTFNVNVFGILKLTQAVAPHMAARKKGLIINIGSVSGIVPTPWAGAYCATKAALHSLTDTLHMELKPLGICVLLIGLGAVRSNLAVNGTITELPDTSLYKTYKRNIVARLRSSQIGQHMPTPVAAKQIVAASLKAKPPSYMSFAPYAWQIWFLSWLPRWVRLWIVWKGQPK